MTSLLAIANASAGTANDDAVDTALGTLRSGADVEVARTSGPHDLDAALAAHPDVDVVVAMGGDGSLHAVIDALHRADRLGSVVVGLVPLGTGNDFARTVGVPADDPAGAARIVLDGRTIEVDLATTADGEVVVNAVHAGVGAEAAAAGKPWKERFGPFGYVIGALTAGFKVPGERLSVRVDGEEIAQGRHVIQAGAGIGRYVGGGTPLLPDADVSDGLLDVAVSFAAPWYRRLVYAWHLRSGRHGFLEDVTSTRGHEVVVRGATWRATNDGELGEPVPEHRWTIQPAAWRLRVP